MYLYVQILQCWFTHKFFNNEMSTGLDSHQSSKDYTCTSQRGSYLQYPKLPIH